MKYKLTQRVNPQHREQEAKWYASPVNDGKIDQRTISLEISEISSLSRGDVLNTVKCLFDTSTDNIGLHLKNIFKENELNKNSVTEDFSVVQLQDRIFESNFDRASLQAAQGKTTIVCK
ncbi:MAG: hypothetical protein LBS55_12475 [Prevotellaceae bacterium]|jgi:hypothetical protein|nr:hypothetical protein [Prevotellaceae bacterium]